MTHCHDGTSSLPEFNNAKGQSESLTNRTLETGAGIAQQFKPVQRICAHLNAFHSYASKPGTSVEANHYCAHVNEEVRQCILYDSPEPGARLIGIEYMISPRLYETLDQEERLLWHSHVFEVKSGMLIMPQQSLPSAVWEQAENKEMETVVALYGKVWSLWQPEDMLPLGKPQLMTSFTSKDQFAFEEIVGDRDQRFGVDHTKKAGARAYIEEPTIHPDADAAWAKRGSGP